jgi:hypothetical protein
MVRAKAMAVEVSVRPEMRGLHHTDEGQPQWRHVDKGEYLDDGNDAHDDPESRLSVES